MLPLDDILFSLPTLHLLMIISPDIVMRYATLFFYIIHQVLGFLYFLSFYKYAFNKKHPHIYMKGDIYIYLPSLCIGRVPKPAARNR